VNAAAYTGRGKGIQKNRPRMTGRSFGYEMGIFDDS
jgi:hypothetical protein